MLKALNFALIAGLAVVFLGSCSLVQRSSDSGYGKGRTSTVRKSSRTDSTAGETSGVPISDKTRLKQLENGLTTKKEVEQYSKSLPWFRDEDERIEFLSLEDFEDRQRWLNEKNFSSRSVEVTNNMLDLVDAQDIAMGMPQTLVKKSWGEPENVEVSGNPKFRNERWRYSKYISTNDGYKLEKKVVYFEAGKVVGWEIE